MPNLIGENSLSKKHMTETLAVVTSVAADGTAICTQGLNGICGACTDRNSSCPEDNSSPPKQPVVFSVPNSLNARVNDVVRIGIPDSSIMISVLIAYVVPLLGLISGAALFELMFKNDFAGIGGAFLGLTFGFCLAVFLSRVFVKTIWAPRMVGVLPTVPGCGTERKS